MFLSWDALHRPVSILSICHKSQLLFTVYVGRPGKEALLSNWNCSHQPATSPCALVSLAQARLHHRVHCAVGGCSWGDLRAEEAEVRWTCSTSATARLKSRGTFGGRRLQKFQSHLNIQASDGSAREGPPPSSQWSLLGSWKGEPVAVDEEKRLHLGLQASRWHLGGEAGTLGFTAEPSGGVVGRSAKQWGRRAPTWQLKECHYSIDYPTEIKFRHLRC